MKVRFQADADLNQDIVQAVRRREPAVDFQTSHEAGLAGLHDAVVLERAAQEGRIVVSHDRRTMPHHSAFIVTRTSAGVLIVSKSLSARRAAEDLILIWAATEAEEWENQIDSLPL